MKQYGEWALITGASSGIGRAATERLCRDGINCVLVSNEKEDLKITAEIMNRKYSVRTIPCCCDLSEQGFLDVIKTAITGVPIGILVNCASFGVLGPLHCQELAVYQKMVKVNVLAYLTLTYEILSGMRSRNQGVIIIVSSVNAYSPVGFSSVYTASKAFELYFGEALWQELRLQKSNIRVLTICPGATRTRFQTKAHTRTVDWAWEPERVIEAGLKRLGKKSSVAISWRGKIYYALTKILPRKWGIKFATVTIASSLGDLSAYKNGTDTMGTHL